MRFGPGRSRAAELLGLAGRGRSHRDRRDRRHRRRRRRPPPGYRVPAASPARHPRRPGHLGWTPPRLGPARHQRVRSAGPPAGRDGHCPLSVRQRPQRVSHRHPDRDLGCHVLWPGIPDRLAGRNAHPNNTTTWTPPKVQSPWQVKSHPATRNRAASKCSAGVRTPGPASARASLPARARARVTARAC